MTTSPRDDWTAGRPALLVTTCTRCANRWYLPHEHCPDCGSADTQETPAAGRGLCVALTRLHVTAEAEAEPVRLVLVELDEGPVVMGRAHDERLGPGDRAVVTFTHDGHDGVLVPSFAQEEPRP